MPNPIAEAAELSRRSIRFAREIDFATAGSRLSPTVERTMRDRPETFDRVRVAVQERLRELGGVGDELGVFMLAADLATTAALARELSSADRDELRKLWTALRSQ